MHNIEYSQAHVDSRIEGLETATKEVNHFVFWSNQQAKKLDQDIRDHVWLDPDFAVPAVRNFQEHIRRATDVLARLEETKQGFQQLPVEEADGISSAASSETHRQVRLPDPDELLDAIDVHESVLREFSDKFSVDFLREACRSGVHHDSESEERAQILMTEIWLAWNNWNSGSLPLSKTELDDFVKHFWG